MDAFTPQPPDWAESARHALGFVCPCCGTGPLEADRVWINRYAPVLTENRRRKWQEFYDCNCGQSWWSWSTDRPVPDWLRDRQERDANQPPPPDFSNN
jgi:hypothetical protein